MIIFSSQVRFKTQCLLAVKDISDNYIALESTTYPGEFLAIQSNGTPYIMKGLVATDYRVHFSLCVKVSNTMFMYS